jgi:hypothetical protein
VVHGVLDGVIRSRPVDVDAVLVTSSEHRWKSKLHSKYTDNDSQHPVTMQTLTHDRVPPKKTGATGFVVAEKEAFALCVAVTNPNQVLSLIEL